MSWIKKRPETPPSVSTDISLSEAYSGLRQRALSTRRAEVGIAPAERDAPAWGALMETGYRRVKVTLFALSDGTTSLYFSNGSGIIGGGDHEAVFRANTEFLNQANHSLDQLKHCEAFPIPEKAETLFYVLTDSGILTGGALESDLASGDHPLSKLFHAGYEAITQLCVISEGNDAEPVAGPEPSDQP
jgi:hypothetical protein